MSFCIAKLNQMSIYNFYNYQLHNKDYQRDMTLFLMKQDMIGIEFI